ncbi:hypothetical protein E8E13_011164 [Curvularia kusanoi]|uniref:Extracellular membrane protein CFEM domain-containing protein n=1 Tax=Curvularia kusanoi TaxID=90978 RepID=A0A9P4W9E9_CURKU|nr:hypothetical protein E8E13_011164 [Curvularia kusanoi]
MSAKSSTIMVILVASKSLAQAGVGSITQDIKTMQDFSLQPNCVQTCFEANFDVCPMDMLGIALGCASLACSSRGWQAKNDCYCRSDLQLPAQDYLDGCISQSCSVGDPSVAAVSAGSIYRQYCEGKGYDIATPASVQATTTGARAATKKTGSTAAPTGTTEDSTTPSSNHTGISTSTLVGIIIGVVLGIILLAIAAYLLRRCHRARKTKLTKEHLAQINGGGQAQPLRPDDSISNFNPLPIYPAHPPLPPDASLVSGGQATSTIYQPPHFHQPYQNGRY